MGKGFPQGENLPGGGDRPLVPAQRLCRHPRTGLAGRRGPKPFDTGLLDSYHGYPMGGGVAGADNFALEGKCRDFARGAAVSPAVCCVKCGSATRCGHPGWRAGESPQGLQDGCDLSREQSHVRAGSSAQPPHDRALHKRAPERLGPYVLDRALTSFPLLGHGPLRSSVPAPNFSKRWHVVQTLGAYLTIVTRGVLMARSSVARSSVARRT